MTRLARMLVALALACGVGSAHGAPRDWPDAVAGRLAHIKATRIVQLGFRENSIPFSYLGPDAKPVGYSLDLCQAIVAAIAAELDLPALGVEYVRVSAQDRIDRVRSGAVDLECGSTTSTAQRQREVAFSPVIFVTGTRLAVPRGSAIRGAADVAGRKVAVVAGTTNEAAMRELDRLRGLSVTFVVANDYREALQIVAAGRADALAADDVLLRGLLAETGRAKDFRLVGEMLSFEQYGIMYPRDDPALAEVVDRTLRELAASREILWIYDRWFVRALPSGGQLDLPDERRAPALARAHRAAAGLEKPAATARVAGPYATSVSAGPHAGAWPGCGVPQRLPRYGLAAFCNASSCSPITGFGVFGSVLLRRRLGRLRRSLRADGASSPPSSILTASCLAVLSVSCLRRVLLSRLPWSTFPQFFTLVGLWAPSVVALTISCLVLASAGRRRRGSRSSAPWPLPQTLLQSVRSSF